MGVLPSAGDRSSDPLSKQCRTTVRPVSYHTRCSPGFPQTCSLWALQALIKQVSALSVVDQPVIGIQVLALTPRMSEGCVAPAGEETGPVWVWKGPEWLRLPVRSPGFWGEAPLYCI